MSSDSERQIAIKKVTGLGSVINLLLSLLKGLFGYWTGSVALIADAVHSLSDLATDLIVIAGTTLGAKPADKNHPFGHGKMETMGTILIAGVLTVIGAFLVLESVKRLGLGITSHDSHWIIMAIAGFSLLMKEWIYQRTMIVAKETNSTALIANAWHHRSDALSSIAVLIGAVAMSLGWPYGDQSAGIIVGLMVSYAGLKILFEALNELGEAAVDQGTGRKIEMIIKDQPDVRSYHRLRTRRSGHVVLMDIHILVNPSLSLIASHNISKKVEQALQQGLECPLNITVHVEPDIPTER